MATSAKTFCRYHRQYGLCCEFGKLLALTYWCIDSHQTEVVISIIGVFGLLCSSLLYLGIPLHTEPVLNFIDTIVAINSDKNAPIIIHCR